MATAYEIVYNDMKFLGDVFLKGMIKKGLDKVGKSIEEATADDMLKAIDLHIAGSLEFFVAPQEAKKIVSHMKSSLADLKAKGM